MHLARGTLEPDFLFPRGSVSSGRAQQRGGYRAAGLGPLGQSDMAFADGTGNRPSQSVFGNFQPLMTMGTIELQITHDIFFSEATPPRAV